MLKYGKQVVFDPAKLHTHNIDRQSLSAIPYGARVLEIGCATGFMGKYLIKEKGCTVFGVELGHEEYIIAKRTISHVINGDIEGMETIAEIKKQGKFDVVFASALIEHLKDPWKALALWKQFLKRDGMLLVTTSNIAHWSMRLQLLRGDFTYRQYGILDNTHLRFFTPHTFRKLVNDCGYRVDLFSIDDVGGGYPKVSMLLSKIFPSLFAYQMLIVAKPIWK